MKTFYIRFGRKIAIPSTIQIKDEIRRMVLDGKSRPAGPAEIENAPATTEA